MKRTLEYCKNKMAIYVSHGNTKMVKTYKATGKRFVAVDVAEIETCPMAGACKKYCYVPKLRNIYKTYDACIRHNTDLIRELVLSHQDHELVLKLMDAVETSHADVIRIHASGDFFHIRYYMAWIEVAKRMPHIQFFGYTKMLPFLVDAITGKNPQLVLPQNMVIQYSWGGKKDHDAIPYIKNGMLPTCFVVDASWEINTDGMATKHVADGFDVTIPMQTLPHHDFLFITHFRISFGIKKH